MPLTDRLSQVRVAVVGDVMLDRYWWGQVERISPESPVPVVDVDRTDCRLGGAANVAANVVGLGAECTLISIVGDDDAGNLLCGLLDDSGIHSRVVKTRGVRTTEKLRIVARNQQLLRVDFESRPTRELLAQTLDDLRGCLDSVDLLILSDYGKGGLAHIEAMIRLARDAGKSVVVDPKGNDYSRYRGATVVTPNLKEFEHAGGETQSEERMERSAMELVHRFELGALLVTRSEKGMTLYTADNRRIHSPARAREVFDVSGAGDTVAAVVGVGIAAGLSFESILDLANRAAGQVIGKFGTAVIELASIEADGLPGEQT